MEEKMADDIDYVLQVNTFRESEGNNKAFLAVLYTNGKDKDTDIEWYMCPEEDVERVGNKMVKCYLAKMLQVVT